MNLKVANAKCYEHRGAYLWVWQDYAGAWQARAGGVAPKHLRTSQVKSWGDVEVLLMETAKSFVSLDDSHSLAVRRLALAVRNSWLSRSQSVGIGLSPSDLVAAGVTTPAYVAIVAKGGSYAHLWREPGGWRARIATPTWVHESDSELTAGHAVRALWSRTEDDPSWLRERVLAGELNRAAQANGLDEEPTVSPPAVEQPPEPLPATRPLPANLAERFGALVADLLAAGGAHEDLGHQLLCLAAGEDLPREPAETRQEGWWQDCERDARDAFAAWITCWRPGVLAPQFGGMDIHLDWGWQTAGRPHVWWGESSDDAEGAALAESARLGRSHRLVRVVAQTEMAPRGHWRMRPVGGEE